MMGRLKATREKFAAVGLRGALDSAYRKSLFEAYCYVKNREFESGDKRVWVHIGAHKTGSTSLQGQLQRGRSQLRESSVLYDRAGLTLGRRLMRESPLSEAALSELNELWRRSIASRRERTVLLSYEGFFGDPYVGYSNGKHTAHDLRRILGDYAVDIIAVVRKQDRWTESTYQQYVKEGSVATFAEFLRECGPYPPAWDELLDPWVSEFGRDRVHVHLFEATFRDDVNAVERLFGGLGEPLKPVADKSTRDNPGLSADGAGSVASLQRYPGARGCREVAQVGHGEPAIHRWIPLLLRRRTR